MIKFVPGPGTYNSKSQLGDRGPGMGYGNKSDWKTNDGPGPGYYDIDRSINPLPPHARS